MIIHVEGNLLESDCDILFHQSNCLGGYGSGIAGQIRKDFPGAYEAFDADKRQPVEKLGKFSYATENIDGFGAIFNIYGQYDFGGRPGVVYTNYDALRMGIKGMLQLILEHTSKEEIKEMKIGCPYKLGAGLAGGDWNIISKIIEEEFDKVGCNCYTYEYTT